MIKVEELSIRSFTTNGGSTRWRIWSEDKKQYFPFQGPMGFEYFYYSKKEAEDEIKDILLNQVNNKK